MFAIDVQGSNGGGLSAGRKKRGDMIVGCGEILPYRDGPLVGDAGRKSKAGFSAALHASHSKR